MQPLIRSGMPHVKGIRQNCVGDLEYLTFPMLEETGVAEHLFTTRTGGVSEGDCATMNLSFTRGDNPDAVLENYRRVLAIFGKKPEDAVASVQTHTTNIRRVTGEDRGRGVVRPTEYTDVDGLITNEPGIVLVTFFADCVPLYFVDPVKRAIGLAHSGWRGTVAGMGACMVRAMEEAFGSRPEDLFAAIGPSICRDCYEVSEDVASEFCEKFQGPDEKDRRVTEEKIFGKIQGPDEKDRRVTGEKVSGKIQDLYEKNRIVTAGKFPGKYQLDLWLANRLILEQAGVPSEHISVTDVCTCHNPNYLFSHRASKGKRGNMGALLMLREPSAETEIRIKISDKNLYKN